MHCFLIVVMSIWQFIHHSTDGIKFGMSERKQFHNLVLDNRGIFLQTKAECYCETLLLNSLCCLCERSIDYLFM